MILHSFLGFILLAPLLGVVAFVPLQQRLLSSVLSTNLIESRIVLLATTKRRSWEQRWDDNYEKLKAFQEKFGTLRVGKKDPKLADWVRIQQENFNLGVMRQDRMNRLSALGFISSSTRSPTSDKAINTSTQEIKTSSAEEEQSEKLSAWDQRWEDSYQKLKAFKERSGHTDVSSSKDPKLVNWVRIQRENLRRGVMNQGRRDKLEEIGLKAQDTRLLDKVKEAFADKDLVDSVTKAYVASPVAAGTAKSATARHILVKTKDDVQTVLDALATGESNFRELAERYSTCPSGKQNGGLLGTFSPGKMVPEFDKVIFDKESKLDEVLGPVETLFGYHLIVIEKRTGV